MASTTITLTDTVYKPLKKTKVFGQLDEIGGRGLLQLAADYYRSVHPDSLVDHKNTRYTKVGAVSSRGCMLVVKVEHGTFGNTGTTYDVSNHTPTHKRTSRESATVETRVALVVPPGARQALFMIEREGRFGGGAPAMHRFMKALRDGHPDHYFPQESVQEPQAWLEAARMVQLEVKQKHWKTSLKGDVELESQPIGTVRHILEPEDSKIGFTSGFKKKILEKKINAAEYLHLDEVDEDDMVTLATLKGNGRTKTFELDSSKNLPTVRIQLTSNSEPRLEDEDFIRRCFEEAKEYYERNGLSWDSSWERGEYVDVNATPVWEHQDLTVEAPGETSD